MPQMVHGFAFRHPRGTRTLCPRIAVECRLRPSMPSIRQRRQNSLERVFEFHGVRLRKLRMGFCLKSVILSEGEREIIFIRDGLPSRSRRTLLLYPYD